MTTVSKINDFDDPAVGQNEQLISFWGLACISGNQYSQVVKRRFRLTKAVLDPHSYSKDEKNKIVKVNVIHRGCDYLLCILKHEEIYQVSLNLMFDKGEKVIFFIEGHGKVYLSGYEVNDSINEIPWDESLSVDLTKEVKASSPKKTTPTQSSSKFQPQAESSKNVRKAKAMRKVPPDETKVSPKPYLSMLFNGQMNEGDDDDDDDDEDFSVGSQSDEETESDDEDFESEDEDIDESEIEDEVQVLEDEILGKVDEEEEEEIEITETTVPQKRKRQVLTQQPVKRTKKDNCGPSNANAVENDVIICEDNSEESSDSGFRNKVAGCSPISKTTPAADSSEKKKKKKKKKKKLNEMSNTFEQVGKSPKSPSNKVSSKKLRGGVEIHDLVVGRGPEATSGKLIHIFYIGRLENKEIFDSRVPGKKPLAFKLGKNSVIRGLEVGLEGMKVGGKRRLTVPPSMGYGSAQVDNIPPNSTLEFTVELQAVS